MVTRISSRISVIPSSSFCQVGLAIRIASALRLEPWGASKGRGGVRGQGIGLDLGCGLGFCGAL